MQYSIKRVFILNSSYGKLSRAMTISEPLTSILFVFIALTSVLVDKTYLLSRPKERIFSIQIKVWKGLFEGCSDDMDLFIVSRQLTNEKKVFTCTAVSDLGMRAQDF